MFNQIIATKKIFSTNKVLTKTKNSQVILVSPNRNVNLYYKSLKRQKTSTTP